MMKTPEQLKGAIRNLANIIRSLSNIFSSSSGDRPHLLDLAGDIAVVPGLLRVADAEGVVDRHLAVLIADEHDEMSPVREISRQHAADHRVARL